MTTKWVGELYTTSLDIGISVIYEKPDNVEHSKFQLNMENAVGDMTDINEVVRTLETFPTLFQPIVFEKIRIYKNIISFSRDEAVQAVEMEGDNEFVTSTGYKLMHPETIEIKLQPVT